MPDTPFDEVAVAAASGASPIVIAVSNSLDTLASLASWLESAVPTFGAHGVEGMGADELNRRLSSEWHANGAVVVPDASAGDDLKVVARWQHWNSSRERLLEAVDYGRLGSLVLLATSSRMPVVAAASPHLFSVASVITVDRNEDVVVGVDPDTQAAYEQVLREMEARYGLSTKELIDGVILRKDLPVSGHDLARWEAAAEALQIADR